jgi:hypothetical protein
MSNSTPPQSPKESFVANPQILAAVITAVATVLVALITVLPNLIPKETPTSTAVVIVVTPTEIAPSSTPTETAIEITSTPVFDIDPLPTNIPTSTATLTSEPVLLSMPTSAATPVPNILLMYDDVSFTLLNQTSGVFSLEGVVFRSSAGEWDAAEWGPSLYNRVPSGMCLRLRDASVGQRQPPQPCVNQIYGLIETQGNTLFWIGVEQFDVIKNGTTIATCIISQGSCPIYVP